MFDSQDNRHSRNRTNFSLSAIFAILLGIVFLLNNFGILPWELWQNLWKFWPVLLILFGVEVILGRSVAPRSFGLLLLLIFLVPIVLILNPLTGNLLSTQKINLEQPLRNLTKAELLFEIPSAKIKVGSLAENDTKVLVGTMSYSKLLPKPELKEESKFGETKFSFKQTTEQIPFLNNLGNNVDLKISRLIPYEIQINSNTANLDLNLEKVRLDLLNLQANAGKFNLILSKDYSSRVYIKAAAAIVTFKIPSEAGVSFKTNSSIKQLNLPLSRFDKKDNQYKSKNYEQAINKVDIEVFGPLASVEIKS